MPYLTQTEIKQVLRKYNIHLNTAKGQNFLVDKNILKKIIKYSKQTQGDNVMEIGFGLGGLTYYLAKESYEVFAVDIDKRLFNILKNDIADFGNVTLFCGDVLKEKFDKEFEKWLKSHECNNFSYKIIANIPYVITSLILKKFLTYNPVPKEMIIMVQKEVGKRILAKRKDMNVLALMVKLYATPKKLREVSKACFWPKPKVDSVVLSLDLTKPHKLKFQGLIKRDVIFKLINMGFSHKRKKLSGNLSLGLNRDKKEIENIMLLHNISKDARAQDLNLASWEELTKELLIKK
jgi:16S rRNA (adenine1518-N6/adenine1519-N6)-dimethyltransferase